MQGPSLYFPALGASSTELLYKSLYRCNPKILARIRSVFLPASEIIIELAERLLTSAESLFKTIYCHDYRIFYAEKTISNITGAPLFMLAAPFQYAHQFVAILIDPKSASRMGTLKTEEEYSYAKNWLSSLQKDWLYKQPEPSRNPWISRCICPLTAITDIALDTLSPLAKTVECVFLSIMQLGGAIFFYKHYSVKKAIFLGKEALQSFADTLAATALSPFKLIYQVCAICYDPTQVVSIHTEEKPYYAYQNPQSSLQVLPQVPVPPIIRTRILYGQNIATDPYDPSGGAFSSENSYSDKNTSGTIHSNLHVSDIEYPYCCLTLKDFKYLSQEKRNEISFFLGLETKIKSLEEAYDFYFITKLAEADDNVLDLVTLFDLKQDITLKRELNDSQGLNIQTFLYLTLGALLSDEDFSKICAMPWEELNKISNPNQLRFILNRLALQKNSRPSQNTLAVQTKQEKLNLYEIIRLPAKELLKLKKNITSLHPFCYTSPLDLNTKIPKLTTDHLNELIEDDLLDTTDLELLSISQLSDTKLDLSKINCNGRESDDKINYMFHYEADSAEEKKIQAARLAAIPDENLKKIINRLSPNAKELIPNDRLSKIAN